jgi:hypothetical protein
MDKFDPKQASPANPLDHLVHGSVWGLILSFVTGDQSLQGLMQSQDISQLEITKGKENRSRDRSEGVRDHPPDLPGFETNKNLPRDEDIPVEHPQKATVLPTCATPHSEPQRSHVRHERRG